MRLLLSLTLALGILAACPSRALPCAIEAPTTPAGEFTVAEYLTPWGETDWLVCGYETERGVWVLEEIPLGYTLVQDTKLRLSMVEFLHTPCPNCTGEVLRTTWLSGGLETEVETPRIDDENRVSWRRRHRANVDEALKDFPPDPPQPTNGSVCATPHHQGGPAVLTMLESGDLEASELPVSQMALLVRSPFLAAQPAPFGEGFLCLHNLHLTRELAFSTANGLRVLTPTGTGWYQTIFRDCDRWEPASGCDSLRYNVSNVVDTRGEPLAANGESVWEENALWQMCCSPIVASKQVEKFDGTLGTLLRAEIWFRQAGWQERGYENLQEEPDCATFPEGSWSRASLTFTAGMACAPQYVGQTATYFYPPVTINAGPFDGTVDFQGESGTSLSTWMDTQLALLATFQATECLRGFVDVDGAANGLQTFTAERTATFSPGPNYITYCDGAGDAVLGYWKMGAELAVRYYYKAN